MSAAPFYHFNRADYDSRISDNPVATTWHQRSNYGGAQADARLDAGWNSLSGGLYSFVQNESDLFGVTGPNCSPAICIANANAGLVEFYLGDHLRLGQYVTLLGGERFSLFRAELDESATYPRIGATVRIPRLNWVLRGILRALFQPAPILTVSSSVLNSANSLPEERTPSRRFHRSATRSINSASRFRTGGGCWTWIRSRRAPTTSSIIRAWANRMPASRSRWTERWCARGR